MERGSSEIVAETDRRHGGTCSIDGSRRAKARRATGNEERINLEPGTLKLIKAFNAALTVRLRQLRGRLQAAVITDDILGLNSISPIALLGMDNKAKLAAFQKCMEVMTAQALAGLWVEVAITKTWVASRERVSEELGAPVHAPTPPDATTAAQARLATLGSVIVLMCSWIAEHTMKRHLTSAKAGRNDGSHDLVPPARKSRKSNRVTLTTTLQEEMKT
jgi:hypothetical protein